MALWFVPTMVLGQAQATGDSVPDSSALDTQYVLQVGAFGDSANAARLSEDLRDKGYPSVIKDAVNETGAKLSLVLAGPFPDADTVVAAQSALASEGIEGFVRTATVRAAQPSAKQRQAPTTQQRPQDARSGPSAANLVTDQEQLLARAQQDMFEVPPVVERPLGMEEGPRVVVSRFDLTGAVTREKQGISVGDLNVMLNGHVQSQPPDGFTINQLQSIADEITRHYRERGFVIAQAIVPAQEVRDGVVNLHVLEGSLQNVRVEGNTIYKARVVEGPFRSLQGEPVVQASIEQALLDVQEFPGLTVFGTFTQGEQVGNTDLVVRVREEDRFYFTPSVDNYGNEFTGEYRAMLDFQLNNLFGFADKTTGYVLQTFEPDNGTYGGLGFEFPFGRNSISFGGSYNQFDVGGLQDLTILDVEGTVAQGEVFWNRSFANGRYFGANGHLGVALKNAETTAPGIEAGGGDILAEDKLTVVVLDFDFFKASRKGRGFTFGSIGMDIGLSDTLGSMGKDGDELSSRIGGDGEYAGGDFTKFRFRLEHLQRLTESNSMLLRLDGQYTSDMLVSLEQYSIGGPRNVRAYTVAEALADIAGSATLEWIINAPGFSDRPGPANRTWGEIFQVSLYADYAYGELNNPRSGEEPTVDYSGYGLGLQFNVPGTFYARFDVASPIGSREAVNDRDPQYYFRMSYTF
jgi:hemolysin activation/secretion protein